MSRLFWDQVGERSYEAGIDHGVLYLADGSGIPWNGLISIEEDMGGDSSEPSYFDGVKILDIPSTGDFSASLSAFTCPEEFMDLEGISEISDGMYVDGQDSKTFGLSYRSQIGNDILGIDYGYKIHLLYNLTATSESKTHETLNDSANLMELSWKISGVPEQFPNYRPTAHIIFDSRFLDPEILLELETILYGQDGEIEEIIDGGTPFYHYVPISPRVMVDAGVPSYSTPDVIDGNPEVIDILSVDPQLPTITDLLVMFGLDIPS